ncbi:MAG: STT3 domain-containing protein [Thermoprotei archaeon]
MKGHSGNLTYDLKRIFASPLIDFIVLILVFFIGLAERLEPLVYLQNNGIPIGFPWAVATLDPFFHYFVTLRIVEYGPGSFFTSLYPTLHYPYWNDTTTWFPGRDVTSSYMVGIAYFSAFTYWFARFFDFYPTVGQITVYMPAILGALTVVMLYPLGKALYGRKVGLIAAVIGLIMPAFINRSMAGHIDGEPIDLFLWTVALTLLIKGYKQGKPVYGLISGLIIGFSGSVWGGYLYVMNALAIFAVSMVLLERIDDIKGQVLISTIVPSVIVSAMLLPKAASWSRTFSAMVMPTLTVVLISLYSVWGKLSRERLHMMSIGTLILAVASFVIMFIGAEVPALASIFPSGRLATVINPFAATGIETTVGEQQLSNWLSFYQDYLFALPLIPFSIYLLLKNRSDLNILIALLVLMGVYAQASMVRLDQLLAIPVAIAGGYAIERILAGSLRSVEVHNKGLGATVILGLVLVGAAFYSVKPAYYDASLPPMIDTGLGTATVDTSWLQALEWLKTNTPQNAVVASWWDYGYWLNTVAGKTTLNDGATISTSRIRQVAYAFLGNQTEAYDILYKLGAQYVVATEAFGFWTYGGQVLSGTLLPIGIGDIGKSTAMMTIAGWNSTKMSLYLNSTYVQIASPQVASGLGGYFDIPMSNPYVMNYGNQPVSGLSNGNLIIFMRNDTVYQTTITNATGIENIAIKANESSATAAQWISKNERYDGILWTQPKEVPYYNTFLYQMLMDPFIYPNQFVPYFMNYGYLASIMQSYSSTSSQFAQYALLYSNLENYAPLTKFQLVYAALQPRQGGFVLVVVYKLNPAPPLSKLPLEQAPLVDIA